MTTDHKAQVDAYPCPFCGGSVDEHDKINGKHFRFCWHCNAAGPQADSSEEALKLWERRAVLPASTVRAQVEAARVECHKARRETCGAWSNVMTGPNAVLPDDMDAKCDKAQAAETSLREAIDSLATLASAPPAPAAPPWKEPVSSDPLTQLQVAVVIAQHETSPAPAASEPVDHSLPTVSHEVWTERVACARVAEAFINENGPGERRYSGNVISERILARTTGHQVLPPAASSDALAAARWQPIATAPKDGTEILVWSEDGVQLVAWIEEKGWPAAWSEPQSWQDEQGGYATVDNPTHWMPVPAGPSAAAIKGEQP